MKNRKSKKHVYSQTNIILVDSIEEKVAILIDDTADTGKLLMWIHFLWGMGI